MEDNPEIYAKYQKLALEYSKLKAQATVLKTAVSEEKSNTSDLQEALKKKDQFMRKLEQEVECLNFRNLQLSKRVSVLQSDLESIDNNSKHSKAKQSSYQSVSKPESFDVMNLELKSRIEENERLHQQVYAADLEYQKKISDLTSIIEDLKRKCEDQDQNLNRKITEQESTITNLQKEKIKLQVCIKNNEKEFKDRRSTEETNTRDITVANEDLTVQLEDARKVIAEKVLFNDKQEEFFNRLNVPIIQRGKHTQLISLMLRLQTLVSDFSRQLSDLNSFMIQRLCTSPLESSIKRILVKLEAFLRESIQQLKLLPITFEKITNCIKDESWTYDKSSITSFSETFQKYERNLNKLAPFLILRIHNKDSLRSSSTKILELFPKLVSITKKLMASIQNLHKYILLLSLTGSTTTNAYHVSQSSIIKKILSILTTLQMQFDDARQLFSSKIALDHQMPTLTDSEKSTDECILSTLVSLSLTLKKIADILEKDLELFSNDVWYKPRISAKFRNVTLNPCVWQYKERGAKYIESLVEPEPLFIPYEIAASNHQTLSEQADNQENLTQQLEHYQNKVMQLELDKENWMLECQLLKAKSPKNPDSHIEGNEFKGQDYDEIQLFVKNTVNQFIKQIQFADSKAIAFKNECEALHQRLKMSLEKKEFLENEIKISRQAIQQMKEEQKTLTQSYDEQLNTMSEHLANLNEILTAQKDEIDALKQSGNKGSKKGRSK